MTWLTDFWPWWVAFFWLIVYELYALWTQWQYSRGRRITPGARTLSQLATNGARRYPWTAILATCVVLFLLLHFYAGVWWGW